MGAVLSGTDTRVGHIQNAHARFVVELTREFWRPGSSVQQSDEAWLRVCEMTPNLIHHPGGREQFDATLKRMHEFAEIQKTLVDLEFDSRDGGATDARLGENPGRIPESGDC
jgi:hypothetical protein